MRGKIVPPAKEPKNNLSGRKVSSMLRRCFLFLFLPALAAVLRAESAGGDLVIADFNHGYGGWTAEGEAFGEAPAAGTLQRQRPVSGFVGEGLVNTFLDGTVRPGHSPRRRSPSSAPTSTSSSAEAATAKISIWR